jgi:ATP-dependent Clp protease ATP-binding subunit ClpA
MYERFTDRARKVMQMSNMEAHRLQHEYIGTEHILLGLIAEGAGVAARVFRNLGVDLEKVRREVEKIVMAGPDMLTIGKLPLTPRAKRVIEFANEEARFLEHNYIGTEHLLLGSLREVEGVGAQVLMNIGLRLSDVRDEVLNLVGNSTEMTNLPQEQLRPEPDIILEFEVQHLPAFALAIVNEFDRQIEMLQHEKNKAVDKEDWEQAAQLRNWQFMLKSRREEFITRWPKSAT